MDEIPEVLKRIPQDNRSYKIKLRARKNRTDVWRLYLDYYENGKRQIQNLDLHIGGTSNTKIKDQEIYRLALAIRNRKEREILENKTGIQITQKDKPNDFIEFFRNFSDGKPDRNYRIASNHFSDFIDKAQLDFTRVDYQLSEKFKNYLLAMDVTPYTAQHYFAAYKACLNQAVKLGKIEKNPAGDLSIKFERKTIERLTEDELEKLKSTDCRFQNIKNSFLFACYTGLRVSDLRNLKFSNIRQRHIKFIQQKTRSENTIKLSQYAKFILKEQEKIKKDDYVFHIPSGGRLTTRLNKWFKDAGISKDLTFHSSRHTFGCLLIENGVDVFSVKKLMGHREIKTTMQYVDKVDTTVDRAIDQLDR